MRMKNKLKIVKQFAIVLLIAGGIYVIYTLLSPPVLLSNSQEQIRNIFGEPSHFMLSYLKRGEDDTELVRYELWFYPDHKKKIKFLAGKLLNIEYFDVDESLVGKTKHKPENFDYFMGYEDLRKYFGEMNIEKMELPVFFDKNIETYVSQDVVFVVENGRLSYVQTYGVCIEGQCLGDNLYINY